MEYVLSESEAILTSREFGVPRVDRNTRGMIDSDLFLSPSYSYYQYVLVGPRLELERLKWVFLGAGLEYSDLGGLPVL